MPNLIRNSTPQKILSKKKITLDDLAVMCMREFTSIRETMATKKDIEKIWSYMFEKMATKNDLLELEVRMDTRFNRIETILVDHTYRIERLEQVVEMD